MKGKLLLDFQTKSVVDFEHLWREIEANYLEKRGTSHLQLEFNALKQKPGESTGSKQKRTILNTSRSSFIKFRTGTARRY